MWQYSNIILVIAAFLLVWSPVSSFTTCRSFITNAISSSPLPSLSSAMFASLDAISDAKQQIEDSM